jgi:glycosyltransferase involved in cell wall biosynthesis
LKRRRTAAGSRPLRVAQIVCTADGAAWVAEISDGLRARGHDVRVFVNGPEGPLVDRLRALDIPVHSARIYPSQFRVPAPLRYLLLSGSVLVQAARLARLLRREHVDVVHTHIWWSILIGRIASWLARTPIRLTHVPGPFHLETTVFRKADRLTQWMEHRLIAGCRFTDSIYASLGVPASRRSCIYYGADPARFDPGKADPERLRAELGIEAGAPLVGHVAYFYGRLLGRSIPAQFFGKGVKAQEDLVDAARLVLAEIPEARFVFVGSGWQDEGRRYEQDVRERAAELGLGEAIVFTGARDDVPDVLAALDVSVQCSLSENLGGTIESLMMEVPTVATQVGGMPESVHHEETGLLVPPGDPRALADAILRYLRNPDWAKSLARAGRLLMLERFTMERTVQDIDALYSELARERGVVRPVGRMPVEAEARAPL